MRKCTKKEILSALHSSHFMLWIWKLGDQLENDSVLSNYKLQFVTGALEEHYQQGVYNLLTCKTIWNYVHFYIGAYFNHSVLSRILVPGFDLFCMRVLCYLVPKWLVNTFSCPQRWSWWFGTMVEERSMKSHGSPVALWLQAALSLPFIFSPICAKFQFSFITHLQQLFCRETTE